MAASRNIDISELKQLLAPYVGSRFVRGPSRPVIHLHQAVDPALPESEWAHYWDADIRALDAQGVHRFSVCDTELLPWDQISRVEVDGAEFRVVAERVTA